MHFCSNNKFSWGVMSDILIHDESSNHKYRTEIPNIISELGLKSHHISLYWAIKKAAGDNGNCTKSKKSLCKDAGIGLRNYSKVKAKLCESFSLINDKSLIKCETRISEYGDQDTDSITIIDIWLENYKFYYEKRGRAKLHPPLCKNARRHAKLHGWVVQNCTQGRAKLHPKQEQQKKNLYKEKQQQPQTPFFSAPTQHNPADQTSGAPAAAVFYKCLMEDTRLDDDNRCSLMRFTEDRVKLALEYSLKIKPKKTLIHQLMWHCGMKNPPIAQKNFWELVLSHFKNQEEYNKATCYIDGERMTFERGLTRVEIYFKDPNSQEKFNKALEKFGIKWSCE